VVVVACVLAALAVSGPLAGPGGAQGGSGSRRAAPEELPTAEQRRVELSTRLGEIQVALAEAQGRAGSSADAVASIDAVRLPQNRAAREKAERDRAAPVMAQRELILEAFVRGDPRGRHLLDTLREGVFELTVFTEDVLVRTAEDQSAKRIEELDALMARLDEEAVQLEAEREDKARIAAEAAAEAEALAAEKAALEAELASVDRQIARLQANQVGAPLTGLAQVVDRPALAVKIDNLSPARPQSGLNEADVVYEELVESGITRYIAIFQSTDAEKVGPIRSGRTSDLLILANLNRALYGASGGNAYVLDALRGANLVSILDGARGVFYRDPARDAPHNLYSSTEALYGANPGGTSAPPRLFGFRAPNEPVANGRPVAGAVVNVGDETVTYSWNGHGWERQVDGVTEEDANGIPIAPANVVIQFTDYGSSAADAASPEAQVTGEGEAWVLTGGQVVEGTWSRPFPEEVTHYLGPDGQEIGLTPGRTWILLPRPGDAELTG
jgi:hypothetical protein